MHDKPYNSRVIDMVYAHLLGSAKQAIIYHLYHHGKKLKARQKKQDYDTYRQIINGVNKMS